MSTCTELMNNASAGVAPALRAVDCVAGETTASAFTRLFGADGAMAPVLTIVLTLYIAFFAVSLLTGRSRLGISALTPRMLTLGLVLTFATSWIAYQQVVWNLAVGGPDWIATVLTGSDGSASQIFADKIDIVFAAIAQAGEAAGGAGEGGGGGGAAGSFGAADAMWLGALILLLGTVGVLLTARIALAILLALGPVFVVMALFGGTRGLTAGWLKAVALTALTPLFVVLGGTITLELMVPVLAALADTTDGISGRAAMALFTIAAVHAALMIMVFKLAATIVAGWNVFGAARDERAAGTGAALHAPAAMTPAAAATGAYLPPATAANRPAMARVVDTAAPHGPSAPDPQSPASPGDRRSAITHVHGGGIQTPNTTHPNRTHGIGSRFHAASNDTGKSQMKEMIR